MYICPMRPQKVQDEQMLEGLMSVFRAKGYDGASLNELAGASGLKKASLYHRFPGGKKDMTSAVLTYLEKWISTNIYQVLVDGNKSTSLRLEEAIVGLRDIYGDGMEVCMYRSLSLDAGITLFGDQIKQGIDKWMEGFRLFGIEKGMSEEEAIDSANKTFIDIQGSLVLSKAMAQKEPFIKILEKIRERYT